MAANDSPLIKAIPIPLHVELHPWVLLLAGLGECWGRRSTTLPQPQRKWQYAQKTLEVWYEPVRIFLEKKRQPLWQRREFLFILTFFILAFRGFISFAFAFFFRSHFLLFWLLVASCAFSLASVASLLLFFLPPTSGLSKIAKTYFCLANFGHPSFQKTSKT